MAHSGLLALLDNRHVQVLLLCQPLECLFRLECCTWGGLCVKPCTVSAAAYEHSSVPLYVSNPTL